MPMMICVKTVPACVTPGSAQSQLTMDRELRDSTLHRLRYTLSPHTHTQPMKPAVPAAHTHRMPTKLGTPGHAPHPADQAPLHPRYSSHPSEPASPSSSSSSSTSSSSSVSKNGSPRLKRVQFADSVGLPLTEVRVFACEPSVEALQRCPLAMKRAQCPLASGLCSGRCPLHQSMPASPQPCTDYPGFRGTARAQERPLFSMHNDTLRRNATFQKPLPYGLQKAGHTQANAHLLAPAHGPPKGYTHTTAPTQSPELTHGTMRIQNLELTHGTMRTQSPELTHSSMRTQSPELTHATMRTQNPELTHGTMRTQNLELTHGTMRTQNPELTHATMRTQNQELTHGTMRTHNQELTRGTMRTQNLELTNSSMRTQNPELTHGTMRTQTSEHTHPATHTMLKAHPQQPLTHTLPKGLTHTHTHAHTHTHSPPMCRRPPSCGHSVMASRQQPVSWQRSRSPLPPPDSPPRVHKLPGQSWSWQKGMAVH
ncbi:uncharacterized protein LOC134101483 [Sardina pilchardus]|uniref:uncharacterized protein LOC134101483 n=1 Tax=Sardina pilchardus TaxID=27697 RepID=UPI002E104119